MSSDDYFGNDEELDSAVLAQLDAIEAAHSNSLYSNSPSILITGSPTPSSSVHAINIDSYDNMLEDIDVAEFDRLDRDIEDASKSGTNWPSLNVAAGPVGTHQLTLFGDTLPTSTPRTQRPSQQATQTKLSRSPRNPFGRKLRKTKKWDHTAFAKSGHLKLGNSAKRRGEAKTVEPDEETNDELPADEFEQFPSPIVQQSSPPPPPSSFKLAPDVLAAQTWIFPMNQPKRDYQFNIVRHSLFENTLVAVPTGLGKTFIAGVIMLNYYRWFPQGKVVFVAPTKPLVAQQIDACHKTCGIPGGDAVELTGQNSPAHRTRAWAEKRVFYMTPQTLVNDLKAENCNPSDIVLLVVDEAHRATGNYAYAQVVRRLMATNPHFRILALTATPGSKAEAVQAIIDSLHISHIEIRDENSIDLRPYMQPKEISTHIIKMNEDVGKIRDMLAKVMDETAKRLVTHGLLPNYNPVRLHAYRCSALMHRYTQDRTSKKFPWLYSALKKLGVLARAMGYLLECSIAICHQTLQGLTLDEKSKKSSDSFRSDPLFRDLIKELEHQHNDGFTLHPKMEKLQALSVDYFAQAAADAEEAATRPRQDPNVALRTEAPQKKMMIFTNFRASVDEIVDVLNQHRPMIRATPFIGQGADKNGKRGIAQKDQLEVIQNFKDSVYNVLVSTSIGEEGLDIGEVDMIICYDAQKTPIRMLQRVGRTGRKRAGKVAVLLSEDREEANWQKARDDYEAVQTSIARGESLELFGDVERLLPENIKPKCMEMHMAIEEYIRDTKPPKYQTLPKGSKRKRNDDVLRNVPEGAITGFISSSKLIPKRDSKKRKLARKEYDLDDVEDDEDDRAIQAGTRGILPDETNEVRGKSVAKKPSKKAGGTTSRRKRLSTSTQTSGSTLQVTLTQGNDSDDMDIKKGDEPPSPELPSARLASGTQLSSSVLDAVVSSTRSSFVSRTSPFTKLESANSWLLNSDSEVEALEDIGSASDFKQDLVKYQPLEAFKEPQNFKYSPLSQVPIENTNVFQDNMQAPPLLSPVSISSDTSPELSSEVRPLGLGRKHKIVETSSPLSTRQTQHSSPRPSPPGPVARGPQGCQKLITAPTGIWFDIEAEVSGDDLSGGSSDPEEVESESDRRFLRELPATQASPNYNQTAAYRGGLLTQAPNGGPRFTTRVVRRGPFGIERQPFRRCVSSSPAKDEAPDQYSMDSFVVPDDDDIVIPDYNRSSSL